MLRKTPSPAPGTSGCLMLTALLVGVFAISSVQAQTNRDQAKKILFKTTDSLEFVIKHNHLIEEDPEAFKGLVYDRLKSWVNFSAFARGVMGKFYKQATPEQLDRFRLSITNTLIETYSQTLHRIDPKSIKIDTAAQKTDRERKTKKRQQVSLIARIKNGKTHPFKYSLGYDKDGVWRVRNMLFGGINLGLSFRQRFLSEMQRPKNDGDLDKVIENWE